MTPAEKRERIRHLRREASTAKTRLMDILRELEGMDARQAARGLEAVIGRLEGWQNR